MKQKMVGLIFFFCLIGCATTQSIKPQLVSGSKIVHSYDDTFILNRDLVDQYKSELNQIEKTSDPDQLQLLMIGSFLINDYQKSLGSSIQISHSTSRVESNLLHMARVAIMQKQYRKAKYLLNQINDKALLWKTINLLGVISFLEKHYDQAYLLFQKALSLASDQPTVLMNVGLFFLHQYNYSEAEKWFNQASTIAQSGYLYDLAASHIATIRLINKNTKSVEEILEHLLKKYPENPSILHNYAVWLAQIGEKDDANEMIDKSMALAKKRQLSIEKSVSLKKDFQ